MIFSDLPYLYRSAFFSRFIEVVFIWLSFIIFYFIISAKKEKEAVVGVVGVNITSWIGGLLGVFLFAYGGAHDVGNTYGLLVLTLPNTSYIEEMQIVNLKSKGSKYKYVELDLESKRTGKAYYLTLSERRFNYSMFRAGDRLTLKGKENFFGIYVEEFRYVNK
ncbi:hypothetical protein [Methylophilus methylotrophus]|uniref:hypothetical protein n=1 Tax=Methylophilus methylotrophus TaxID=17 RepID=UPI000F5A0838|nr:hypothetical protein [Methylophilus methylotrophus]